jgi:hypothetical protein
MTGSDYVGRGSIGGVGWQFVAFWVECIALQHSIAPWGVHAASCLYCSIMVLAIGPPIGQKL